MGLEPFQKTFLFHNNIQVCLKKVLVVKSDISDNAKPISDNAEFISIAEMPVDVNIHLLDIRIEGGIGRYGGISCFKGHRNHPAFLLSLKL